MISLKKIKKSILFYTIMAVIIFTISHFISKIFNTQYRQWVYLLIFILTLIGTVSGIIQIIKNKSRKTKIIVAITGSIIIILAILFWQLILLIFASIYKPEHVKTNEGEKYVAYVEAFLDTEVYYYDYINFFLVGNKVKIREDYGNGCYDPFDGNHNEKKPIVYYYYDDNGKVIKTNDEYYNKSLKNNQIPDENQETNNLNTENDENNRINLDYYEVLYEKKINETTTIRVVNRGNVLAQRMLIGIEKTVDGGSAWEEQLETPDKVLQVNVGSEFEFTDENNGYIKDPGLAGTDGENKRMLVTTDGGKNFQEISTEE